MRELKEKEDVHKLTCEMIRDLDASLGCMPLDWLKMRADRFAADVERLQQGQPVKRKRKTLNGFFYGE